MAATHLSSISEIFLSARDPETGQILTAGIWQRADTLSRLTYSHEDGEVVLIELERTSDGVSAFDWRLALEIKHGTHSIRSRLRMRPLRIPYLRSPFDRGKFRCYQSLLTKIAAGWKPVGYLSCLTHGAGLNAVSELYPLPFEIDSELGPAELSKIRRDCNKVVAGLEVAQRWSDHLGFEQPSYTEFAFDDVIFMGSIDPQLIRFAGDELMAAYTRALGRPIRCS